MTPGGHLTADMDCNGARSPSPRATTSRFTVEEAALCDDLRFDRIRRGLRLEQERVGYRW